MTANRARVFACAILLSAACGTAARAAAPANQAPTFLPGPDQVVAEDSGDVVFFGWASAIGPGSPDEAGQSLTFLVSADSPFLFSNQPAIDASGTLTFTPAPDAFGIANVIVTLLDDGGSEDGGQDTSAPHLLQIQILPVNDPPVAVAGPKQVIECNGELTFTILNGGGSYDVDDVALAFAWYEGSTLLGTEREQAARFGPGDHLITLVVTDPGGASAESALLVSVVNTPRVLCSTNITVDATNSAGAAVAFTATAAPGGCSSNVTIDYAPFPGSTFPLGTNVVVSTAADSSGSSASCSFAVVVRGPRAIRRDILFHVTPLRSNHVEGVNQELLQNVINRLGLAVLSAAWLDDNHLDAPSGAALFTFEKQTVLQMERLAAATPGSVLTNQLARLVRANRLLAEIAVDDAQKSADRPGTIAAYRKVMAQGDSAAASRRPRAALARYQDAWRKAVRLQRAMARRSVR